MLGWYIRIIVDSGRQPLLLAFVAFILTFLVTRIVVRLIRAGRGPFRNVTAGSVHIHHVVPGIVLVLVGGLLGLGAYPKGFWENIAGLLFGAGAALVLDEFALILHLDDVYWKSEGRKSADAVMIAVAVLLGAMFMAAPNDPPGPPETDPYARILFPLFFIVTWVLPIAITILKGKLWTAALSLAMPWVSWIGCSRLAKPGSPWARWRYRNNPSKQARAQARRDQNMERWEPMRRKYEAKIFGFAEEDEVTKPPSDASL